MCIRNTLMEKNLKTLHNGKTEERRKTTPTSEGALEGSREKTDNAKGLIKHKIPQETLSLDTNLNTDTDTSSPQALSLSLPFRTMSDEANCNMIPLSAPVRGAEEDCHPSEHTSCVSQTKSVLAASSKSVPVPVPRKTQKAVLARQEKVEQDGEEIASQEGREVDVKESKVSSEGKGSASLSVSVTVRENTQPPSLSARKACPPPAPPPRKKPYLSTPEKVPTSAPSTFTKDVEEEDLGLDSCIYEMEISVDKDDEELEEEGRDDRRAFYMDLTDCSPTSSPPSQVEVSLPSVAAEDGAVKVAMKKPQRHSSLMALMQKTSVDKEEGKLVADEKKLPVQDGVLKERAMRDLPSPPDEKIRTNGVTGRTKPSRCSKQRAKSFSGADLMRSDGQRKMSFRKLLDLKLSVITLPKFKGKGGQTPDCTANGTEHHVNSHQDRPQSFHEHRRTGRKHSCPLIGVEQSVDGDEFTPAVEQAVDYENIPHYEEIPDYMNVIVGRAAASSCSSQPAACQTLMYNDEGIYEEQEPYMSLGDNTEHEEHQQRRSEYDR